MATLDSDDVRASLLNKLGCTIEESDHHRYILRNAAGVILATTKVSHGAKHTLGNDLISKMAKQMRLGTISNFVGMVKCSLTREQCIDIINSITFQRG